MKPFARISGVGSAFPQRRVSNVEVSEGLDTSDEWIVERTGIKERRFSQIGVDLETGTGLSFLASQAALEMAGKTALDLDQIFYATLTPDHQTPSSACLLQSRLGAKRAWGIDINAACTGFIFGLHLSRNMIENGASKTSLVIGTDILSPILNPNDRASYILFGDGAACAVVEASTGDTAADSSGRILTSHLGTDGTLAHLFQIPAGGSKAPITPENLARHENKMFMKGKEIFREAVRTMSDYALLACESAGKSLEDVNWVVPHQANLRIIEGVAKKLGTDMSRFLVNLDYYGNTSAATVPSVLDMNIRNGKIKKGDLVLLVGFGSGLTYGSALVQW